MIHRFHSRVPCRSEVILHCGKRGIQYRTGTRDIGLGGLSVKGMNCMRWESILELSQKVRDRYLRIPGRVA